MRSAKSATNESVIDVLYRLKERYGADGLVKKLNGHLESKEVDIFTIKNMVVGKLCEIHGISVGQVAKYGRQETPALVKVFSCAILKAGFNLKLKDLQQVFNTDKTVFSKMLKSFKELNRKNKFDIQTIQKFDATVEQLLKMNVIDEKQLIKIKKSFFISQ